MCFMTKIIPFAFLLVLLGCGAAQSDPTVQKGVPSGPAGVKGSVDLVGETGGDSTISGITEDRTMFSSKEKVAEIMDFLAADALNGRDSGSPGIEKAAQYIEGVYKGNGVKPYFKTFRDTLSNFNKPAFNIVGILEGTDPVLKSEIVLLGAHYDHIGTKKPVMGDTIANGANDNASGTTTVLEIMRYFSEAKTNKRSLVFAFFSAEEKGLLGSTHLAKRLKEEGFNLYTMLNFEMVGVPMNDKDYLAYLTGYHQSNMAEVCNEYAQDKVVGYLPTAKEFNLFMRSDNFPFHKEFNVPSQTFSTFDFTNFDHYHKVSDENSEMDFKHMAQLINAFIPIVEGLSNAEEQEIKYN